MAAQRMICAVDFDTHSMAALHIARRLAEQNAAKLFVIHVVPPTDPLMISAPMIAQRRYDDARARLAEIGGTELVGIQLETVLKSGHPAEEIVGAAEALEADLLVMATHGRTGVPHLVLGSVAEKVLREAPCLVLTVNPKAAGRYTSKDETP
jgi:nucleotide-binding universal stress UspA family protein